MQRSLFSLEDLVRECEDTLFTLGFISHKTVAERLGVTRQAIQHRLRRAHERGELTDEQFQRYSATSVSDPVSRDYQLSSQAVDFIQTVVDTHRVRHSTVVEAALAFYKASLNNAY